MKEVMVASLVEYLAIAVFAVSFGVVIAPESMVMAIVGFLVALVVAGLAIAGVVRKRFAVAAPLGSRVLDVCIFVILCLDSPFEDVMSVAALGLVIVDFLCHFVVGGRPVGSKRANVWVVALECVSLAALIASVGAVMVSDPIWRVCGIFLLAAMTIFALFDVFRANNLHRGFFTRVLPVGDIVTDTIITGFMTVSVLIAPVEYKPACGALLAVALFDLIGCVRRRL